MSVPGRDDVLGFSLAAAPPGFAADPYRWYHVWRAIARMEPNAVALVDGLLEGTPKRDPRVRFRALRHLPFRPA